MKRIGKRMRHGWSFFAISGASVLAGVLGCSSADPEPPAAAIPVIPPGRGAELNQGGARSGQASPNSVPPRPGTSLAPTQSGVKDPLQPVPPPPRVRGDAKSPQ